MRVITHLHQNLNELYLHTQHPYRCPKCHGHRTFLNPNINPIPICPRCNLPLEEDVYTQPGQKELDRDIAFLHTFTPEQAIDIIDSFPLGCIHDTDVMWNRVEYYAEILANGKWTHHGQHWHPIRFNSEGQLLTGAQRLLAVWLTSLPMKAWCVDHSEKWFKNKQWIYDGSLSQGVTDDC